MDNHLFEIEVEVTEVATVNDLIYVQADTVEEAKHISCQAAMFWWGAPEGISDSGQQWVCMHERVESYISAHPEYKGVFTDAELETVKRATQCNKVTPNTDSKFIETIQEAMDEGMTQPAVEQLSKLFGAPFAARCAIELRGNQ